MNREDEIKQINEIINKLDIIQEDEWQQQEGETLEEYNDRIENIEEDIEEELLDYISDSLLIEQEINEEEAIKEAQEKIKNDYKLFSDAFVKNEDGIISLKNEEELAELGYDDPEEIEKLKEIETNMNNPEQYLNKIRESIKASKDIDSEIDRKMELAKSIISAKKRGESVPSSLNPNLEKNKFEKVNEFISNTNVLKKVPTIQKEYISNNYIVERRYNNLINNTTKYNSNNRNATSTIATHTMAQTIPTITKSVPKVVTKKIPERKNIVYTNFEKKLDKDNDLTKQKIKARTELKIIFKEIEDKELTKDELEDLNLKIENIKKKYPNTVTEKSLDKLYTTFKIKLPTKEIEQQIDNIDNTNKDDEKKLEEIQQKVQEELEEIKEETIPENEENHDISTGIKQQAIEVIDEVAETKKENIKAEPKVEVKIEPTTSKIRKKATDVALGALKIGGVIGTTIGTLKQKSGEKIDDLKQKGEGVIENIKQQKQRRKKTTTNPKNETKKVDGIIEKSDDSPVIVTPVKTEVVNNEENNIVNNTEKTEEGIQTKAISNVSPKKSNMSREELIEALKKAERFDTKTMHTKGMNLLVINKLVGYLKENNDSEIQERLNKEIEKLQSDKLGNGKLYIYDEKFTNPETLKYMYEIYRDGVKSTDGNRNIIPVNKNAASYYLFLAHNSVQKHSKDSEVMKKINDEFNANAEETCYRYFEFIKEKHNIDRLKGLGRLKAEPAYITELKQSKYLPNKTEYLDLVISKEFLSRIVDDKDNEEFINKIKNIETRLNNGENIHTRTLKLIGDLYYSGFKNASNEDIVVQDKRKASKIYEQIVNGKDGVADNETYSKLIEIYSDNTTPLYDKTKADKLSEIATKKGMQIKGKDKKSKSKENSTYVCSDLHGEYPAYQAIVSQLKEKDKLYILGDVIDRGPDGIKILQDIMKRKEKGQVEFLIGNHELMMVQSLFLGDEKQKQNWTSDANEGQVTKEAFEKLNSNEQNKIKEFLFNSYVYKNIDINSENVHLVHAKSIQDKNDKSDKTLRELIAEGKEKLLGEAVWSRDEDGKSPHKESAKPNTFTVIGHSPTDNDMIEYKNGYLDIDCGAAKSTLYPNRSVSLVNLTKGIVKYFNINRERKKENNKQKGR